MTCMENTTEENNVCQWRGFIESLLESKSNHAGCKYFVPGSFFNYPESYVSDALVINSALISDGEQVLINVEEHNVLSDIEFKSSICIQHTCEKNMLP